MTPEALEALIYDRIVDLPDVDELDNEQIHAIAHEAALAVDTKAIVRVFLDYIGDSDGESDADRWAEAIRAVQP